MNLKSKIFVAGHKGLLGSALVKKLSAEGYGNLLLAPRNEVDYFQKEKLEEFFKINKPEYVFLAAGRTGGIMANKTFPADFLYENLAIQNHFFDLARKYEVKSLIFYASSCVYPKNAEQPMKESYLLQGEVESTSQAYAAAKLAGLFACQAYNIQYPKTKMICLLPNSLYGPFDNFDLENSHVLSALVRKIHDAKTTNQPTLSLWGSGQPRREFIFSEDAAEASIFAMQNSDILDNKHYNIGTGIDYSIKELALLIAEIVGYAGQIEFDTTKPDGAPKKLLDSSRFLNLGWKSSTDLKKGIGLTYEWFRKHES